ncbi:MAG: hypothetical protein ACI96W_003745, partial [Paraglaciecola sp.]
MIDLSGCGQSKVNGPIDQSPQVTQPAMSKFRQC